MKNSGKSNDSQFNYALSGVGVSGFVHPSSRRWTSKDVIDIELFAGAGGMAIGLTRAGLAPDHLFEVDNSCITTLERNAIGSSPWITGEIHPDDVGNVDWTHFDRPVRLLSGGPPCQPFSNGGKHLAERDARNQFPATLRAIRALRPAAILLENVPGLNRGKFRAYFDYIIRQLECPSLTQKKGEAWQDHDKRLRKRQGSKYYAPEYHVDRWTLNAADHGIGQSRTRVFLVATRAEFSRVERPKPTHGRAALIEYQRCGDYWRDRGLQQRGRKNWPRRVHGETDNPSEDLFPWVTVRDSISSLPEPTEENVAENNHWLISGARIYKGHTGTKLDWPAKTIKAGVHGVAGGENVVHLDDGTFRYFTLREMARLQGFPDDYIFEGSRSCVIRQIGNAVPCELVRCIGENILHSLGQSTDQRRKPRRHVCESSFNQGAST
ncbi:MAG: DNA cytosine methyltransferase [Candidatus Thiodiazotropha sp. (ex Dulcina madagascariensis)]|nr:DNA cytosine methyltransferase [Candidatus Thiodiazotropha sp. (ex Dulcina madagascariensis)]